MKYNVKFPKLGLEMTVSPVAFSICGISVYWYGVLIAAAFLLALWYAEKMMKSYKLSSDKFFNCVITGLITGIIGARLYYVIFSWNSYKDDWTKIFQINHGGVAIYGGIIGALAGGLFVAKIQKLNIPAVLDVSAMGFLLGQGIGRWGNFTNQEAFGTYTSLPWGMMSENTSGLTVHPCFLYESLWCIAGFIFLHFFRKKNQRYKGQLAIIYMVWYGCERMVVEGLRTDSLYLPFSISGSNVRVSQLFAAVTAAFGIILLIIFRDKRNFNLKGEEENGE